MRIVDRKTFLALPAGTVYSWHEPAPAVGGFSDLYIKETGAEYRLNDWYAFHLLDQIELPEDASTDWEGKKIEVYEAAEAGEPFKLDLYTSRRNGRFEEGVRFVVYDRDDVQRLIARLQETLTG